MDKQMGPSAKPMASAEELNKFLEHPDVTVVGFFPAKSGPAYENFKKVADTLRDEFKFAEADSSVGKTYGYEGATVVMFTHEKGEETKVYSGANNKEELVSWIYAKCLPLVGEITRETEGRYKKRNVPIVKLYFDVDFGSNIKRTNYWINRLMKAAEGDAANKLSFTVAKRKTFADEMTKFGLDSTKEASLAIDDFAGNLKFKAEGEVNQDSIKKFVKDYLDGKLEPYIKSGPVPEPNDGPVKVVVGKNFNEIVMDPTKDVMIEMYAPWCGHCKKLEPIYNELGEKLQKEGVSNVVIAKMDATENDSPSAKIQAKGYPTIFFVPANNKGAPLQYSGERDVKSMYDWIKKNSSSWKIKKDEL
jgi:protein disulfide isomerase family A protein 3